MIPKVGDIIILTGLLPFPQQSRQIQNNRGFVLSIDENRPYPVTIFINNMVLSVPIDSVKLVNLS